MLHTSTGEYWDGAQWQTAPVWLQTERSLTKEDHWITTEQVDFNRPGIYLVQMLFEDNAGNIKKPTDLKKHELLAVDDVEAPTGFLNNPRWEYLITPDGERIDANPGFEIADQGIQVVNGRATDSGAGVSDVRVQVEQAGDIPFYWNGSSFQTTPVWHKATLRTTVAPDQVRWSIGDVNFSSSGQYKIRISVIDHSGNRSKASENRRSYILIE